MIPTNTNAGAVIKPFKIVRWPQRVILSLLIIYSAGFIAALVYVAVTHGNGELFTKFRNMSPIPVFAPLILISFAAAFYSIIRNIFVLRRLRRMRVEQARSKIL
ncbi:MAG: hypothetical protein WC763_00500 [Candidatus Paceibacterota bacterium]|jgi:hypothetical protein